MRIKGKSKPLYLTPVLLLFPDDLVITFCKHNKKCKWIHRIRLWVTIIKFNDTILARSWQLQVTRVKDEHHYTKYCERIYQRY